MRNDDTQVILDRLEHQELPSGADLYRDDVSRLIDQARTRTNIDRQRAAFYWQRSRRYRRILLELQRLAEVAT